MRSLLVLINDILGRPTLNQGFETDYKCENCIATELWYKGNILFKKCDRIDSVTPELKYQRKQEAWAEFEKVKAAERTKPSRPPYKRQRPPRLPKYEPPKIIIP